MWNTNSYLRPADSAACRLGRSSQSWVFTVTRCTAPPGDLSRRSRSGLRAVDFGQVSTIRDLANFDIPKTDGIAVVLKRDISATRAGKSCQLGRMRPCRCEFAVRNQLGKFLRAQIVFDDFDSVQPVLDKIAANDNAGLVESPAALDASTDGAYSAKTAPACSIGGSEDPRLSNSWYSGPVTEGRRSPRPRGKIPLLPPGAIFQSSDSSKLSNVATVTRSPPPSRVRVSAPSATVHSGRTPLARKLCQPLVVEPSKRSCQPSAFSWGSAGCGRP